MPPHPELNRELEPDDEKTSEQADYNYIVIIYGGYGVINQNLSGQKLDNK